MPRTKRHQKGPAEWLLGTWRSDKKRTLEKWRWPTKDAARLKRILTDSFGRLTFRFARKRVYSKFEDPKWNVTTYRIAWKNADSIFIVRGAGLEQKGQHIHFLSPTEFWVHAGSGIEYFRKLRRR